MSTAPVKNRPIYREYRNDLNKLTFNSKPIINDLSKKAEVNADDAESVLKAIEDHLRFTVPKYKLPAFYLLDSIAKNVGGMYVSLLHGRLDRIFVDMWRSVDDAVRAKMERTMGTWRNGFEGGTRHLFPEFVLRKIEEDIARLKARAKETAKMVPDATSDDLLDNLTGMQSYAKKRALEERQQSAQRAVVARADSYNGSGHHRHHDQRNGHHKRQRTPEKAKGVFNHELLQQINSMIMKKKVEMLRRPTDTHLFAVHDALKEYKAIVLEAELPPERVREIREQLAALDSIPGGGFASNGGAPPPSNGRPAENGSTTLPLPAADAHVAKNERANGNATGGAPTSIATTTPPANNGPDTNQLLHNIMAQPGLLDKLSSLNNLGKLASGLPQSLGSMLVPQHQAGTGYKEFSQLEPIPLTQVSIARMRPGIYDILYAGFGSQCSQCGWRAREGDDENMKKHLDWHFRRNLRLQNERERRPAPRGWYLDQALWEAGAAAAEAGDQPAAAAAAATPADMGASGEDSAEKAKAELQRMTVAAPPNHNEPCAVCKEAFERRFNEDDEDWELVNAVVVDSTIVHATCNAERH
ncbi:mRNA 3' end processing factor [Coemansia sp. RSA 2705]|nr:mRNA 3' end processing factor [Coemansia sp. RSA 2705]